MKEIISHVVAFSENMVIGIDNKLPWNLPKDLQHFKNYTINKSIIMGRKTYESIGRPLPNRNNIVISKTLSNLEGIYICESLDDALNQARTLNKNAQNEIVMIGGARVFLESAHLVNKLVLTKVKCNIDGDVFYPRLDFQKFTLENSEEYKQDDLHAYDFTIEVLSKN